MGASIPAKTLERPSEAEVRVEERLCDSMFVTKIKGRRHSYTKHQSAGALIAVADVSEEEITELTAR